MHPVVDELETVLRSRRDTQPDGSYSATLFADRERLERKIMEEAFETCLELGRTDVVRERLVSEAADLVFHLTVGLVACDVSLEDVFAELASRRS